MAAAVPPPLLLLGDLGGTNCRLELVPMPPAAAGAGRPATVHKDRYRTADFASLAEMLAKFVAELPPGTAAPSLCCLSVCGPVTAGGGGRLTSVLLAPVFGPGGWTLDSHALRAALGGGCEVLMLNDFHSVGLALPLIPPEDIHTVYAGKPAEHGPQVRA